MTWGSDVEINPPLTFSSVEALAAEVAAAAMEEAQAASPAPVATPAHSTTPEVERLHTSVRAVGEEFQRLGEVQAKASEAYAALRTLAAPASHAAAPEVRAPGIYVASKAKHGERWKALRAAGVPIVSSWIDECGEGETASWSESWSHFVREASTARAVVFYCEAGETHKGALVEIGCALAAGRPVYVVGPIDHSWVNHPLVSRCHSLETAIAAALAAACSKE